MEEIYPRSVAIMVEIHRDRSVNKIKSYWYPVKRVLVFMGMILFFFVMAAGVFSLAYLLTTAWIIR